MGDRITIIIHLPVAVDDFNHVVHAVAERWPNVMLNTNGEDGWLIEVGPDE